MRLLTCLIQKYLTIRSNIFKVLFVPPTISQRFVRLQPLLFGRVLCFRFRFEFADGMNEAKKTSVKISNNGFLRFLYKFIKKLTENLRNLENL